ncbi:biotin transporter BioY [Proteinivorax tanatarense]|uniref:Biotin transporter n=1 Tax=Proteinivorax tanatarense TaxID=1260629 RepID=A0AAU7VJS5_9FIRM
MAIGANATSFLIIGGVPVTLQTFFAIMCGILLGSRLAAVSMSVYTLIGLAGAPVFANFRGGLNVIISPTFGFIISFIFVGFVVGLIIENCSVLNKKTYFLAAIVGLFTNYFIGTHYMYFAYHFISAFDAIPYLVIWGWMIPAFIKDLALTLLVVTIAPRVYGVLYSK